MSTDFHTGIGSGKALFRIGEVSRLTDTKAFVLRYWETEFPMLQPVKSPKGHRLYRKEDVETVRHIKRLLYDEGFTIAGARRHLSEAPEGQLDLPGTQHESQSPETWPRQAHHGEVSPPFDAGQKMEAESRIHDRSPERNDAPSPSPINRKLLLELRDSLRAFLTLLESE